MILGFYLITYSQFFVAELVATDSTHWLMCVIVGAGVIVSCFAIKTHVILAVNYSLECKKQTFSLF